MKRIALLTALVTPLAWGGSPNVNSVAPAVGQRGTEVEVILSGARLADARSLLFNEPGIEVLGVSDAENGKFKAKLKIAPDARVGEYVFRAVTASGIADTRLFYVSPYPVQKEAEESKDEPYKVQPVSMNVTIHGTTPGEDQDHFEVELKKGQRLSAEVVGVRLSTQQQYDPYLSITKAHGAVLAEMDDGPFTRQDPSLSILAPEDGKYRVVLREATNSGPGPCHYLLHIGEHPRPVVIYPGGGMAGTEVKVQMLGDASGPFEQTVKLPDAPDTRLDVNAQKDGLIAPQANYMRVSRCPNTLEGAEPNNETGKATPPAGPLPMAFNGILGEKGDVDFFKFTATKGQALHIRSYSRALRSPVDTVVEIFDAKGSTIASNDDSGNPDSFIAFNPPVDGEYYLAVRDQLMRGGPLFTYRIEISSVIPTVVSYLPEMVINSSQERRAVPVPQGNRYGTLVRIRRADIGGDVKLECVDLPEGVQAQFDKIDKSVDTAAVVFEAKPDAPAVQKTFALLPKPIEPPKDMPVISRVEHRVEVTENGNQRAYYGVDENTLALAVTSEVPVKLEAVQPKVPVLQNGSMGLRCKIDRKAGPDGKPLYNGPVQIQLLYAPPGIGTPGVVTVPEGQNEGTITISGAGNAAIAKWKTAINGSIDMGKGATWISTALFDLETAPPFLAASIKRTFIDQGSEGSITVALEHKVPFDGKAKLSLQGLPQGVTAEDREITKEDKEVKFTLKAAPDAQAGQHKTIFVAFTLEREGEPMTATVGSGGILRVDKAAKVAETKK